MYPGTLRLIQKLCTERVHGNFLVSFNIETYSKMFLPKWSMEISTYPVTLILRLYQKFFTERVHGNFHVSCNIETNIIKKCFTERVHGNFHVPSNIEANSKCFIPTYKWSMEISTYPVTLRLILFKNVSPKGSMEISMYPVILRLIQKFFTKRVDGNFHVLYPLTLRLIQKCFYLKGPWKFPCIL